MNALIYFRRIIKVFFKYVLIYLCIVFFVCLAFSLFYHMMRINNPLKTSITNAYGLFEKDTGVIGVLESIFVRIIDLFLVVYFANNATRPQHPIRFSRYFIYDSRTGNIIVKYWIMMRQFEYLYNAKINIKLGNKEASRSGTNLVEYYWKSIDSSYSSFSCIRGYRYIEIPVADSNIIMNFINDNNSNGLYLYVDISGMDKNGNCYSEYYNYNVKKYMLRDCIFAPVNVYDDCISKVVSELNNKYNTNYRVCDYDVFIQDNVYFMKYENFDKVVKMDCSKEAVPKGYEVNLNKVAEESGSIKQRLLNFLDWFVFYFDWSWWNVKYFIRGRKNYKKAHKDIVEWTTSSYKRKLLCGTNTHNDK